MMTTVYLVRHAQSAPDHDLPEADWPLSLLGRQQADALKPLLTSLGPTRLYSSPYPRAVNTLRPFASQSGLKIELDVALRERKLGDGPLDDFQAVLKRAWADFDFKLPNCESSRECQTRIVQAVSAIADRNANETIAVASHGNAIGLFLNSLDASFGFEDWKQMDNPDLYRICITENGWVWDRDFQWSI